MRNSNILFIVAFLILVWFGAEAFTVQSICATSCISLAGLSPWEDAIAVAVLPVILVIGGIRLRAKEKLGAQTPVTQGEPQQ